jgi:hypothetical protein
MANKNKKKKPSAPQQQMSPMKYVTTGRARLLPIKECWITPNWEDEGLITIIVARQHSKGNITFATFLVDKYCLGLKDTTVIFSRPYEEYCEILVQMFQPYIGKQLIDYTLAHNIIYGAIAYAQDLGFKPEKDWAMSQFILEDDTEDIELMELEFGKDGKPCFINGPYDNVGKIVSKLEASVGKGNFEVVLIDGGAGFDFDGDDYDDEDDNDDDDDFEGDVGDIQDITYEEVK